MNGVRELITQWGRTDTLTDLDVLSLIVGQPVADGLCEGGLSPPPSHERQPAHPGGGNIRRDSQR